MKLSRMIFALGFAIWFGAMRLGAAEVSAGPVAGLTLVKPMAEGIPTAFHGNPGTQIAVALQAPAGGLLGLSEADCVVSACRDDAGTDLLAGAAVAAPCSGFAADASGQHAVLTIAVPVLPGAGAKAITVEASLAVLLGGAPDSRRAELPDGLAPGGICAVGPLRWTVGSFQAMEDDEGWELVLDATAEDRGLIDLVFHDATGAELPYERYANRAVLQATGSSRHLCVFPARPAIAAVTATWHRELRRVMVPVALRTGLDLTGR